MTYEKETLENICDLSIKMNNDCIWYNYHVVSRWSKPLFLDYFQNLLYNLRPSLISRLFLQFFVKKKQQ